MDLSGYAFEVRLISNSLFFHGFYGDWFVSLQVFAEENLAKSAFSNGFF